MGSIKATPVATFDGSTATQDGGECLLKFTDPSGADTVLAIPSDEMMSVIVGSFHALLQARTNLEPTAGKVVLTAESYEVAVASDDRLVLGVKVADGVELAFAFPPEALPSLKSALAQLTEAKLRSPTLH